MLNVNGQLSIVPHLLIFILSFLTLTRFNFDPDLGWHLAYGGRFLEKGEITRADPFSWTMPGYLWDNSYFLYQIIVSFLFAKIGFGALVLIFGLVATGAVLVLTWRANLNLWRFLTILAATLVATINLGVRPHAISFLMFSLLLVFCQRKMASDWRFLPLWFGFFALWANLHRGFVVGLLVLGAYLAIDYFWKKSKGARASLRSRVAVVAAAFLGSLATPSGIYLWRGGVFADLSSPDNLLTIAEWQSVVIYFPANILYALLGVVFIWIFLTNFKKAEPRWFLIGAFLFTLPILATNFVFYFVAIFILVISRYFDFKFDLGVNRLLWAPSAAAILAIVLTIALNFSQSLGQSTSLANRLSHDGYPVEAVKFMVKNGFGDNLFNEYAWGGYLDWQAHFKVFIDGRMAAWRDERRAILGDYLAILKGDCQVAAKYAIKTVLLRSEAKATCFEDFKLVYQDAIAKVLVKD